MIYQIELSLRAKLVTFGLADRLVAIAADLGSVLGLGSGFDSYQEIFYPDFDPSTAVCVLYLCLPLYLPPKVG